MTNDFLGQWANQSEENAKLVAQELLITEVTEEIWQAMEEAGITKSKLAKRMGATKGYVSQVLSGSRNMTLRTLSDICFALRKRPMIAVEAKSHDGEWQTLGDKVAVGAAKLRYKRTGNVIFPMDHWRAAA
ncbi:MAG: helix-turn-helix transcriptional regulator [Pseudomonadota bacterium]|nr:helix-turn-helix transcriptional regulator [Pseudomonadota bacterium]